MDLKTSFFLFSFFLTLFSIQAGANPYENVTADQNESVIVTNFTHINLTQPDSSGHYDYVDIQGTTHKLHTGRLIVETTPCVVKDGQVISQIDNIDWYDYAQNLFDTSDNTIKREDESGTVQIEETYFSSLVKENIILESPVDEVSYGYNISLQDWTTKEYDLVNNTTSFHTELAANSTTDISIDEWGNAVISINGANTVVLPIPNAEDSSGKKYQLTWDIDKTGKKLRVGNLWKLQGAVYPVTIDPTELIENGGFESGSMTPWTQYKTAGSWDASNFVISTDPNHVHSGNFSGYSMGYKAHMDTGYYYVGYTQNITGNGQAYNISCYLQCNLNYGLSGSMRENISYIHTTSVSVPGNGNQSEWVQRYNSGSSSSTAPLYIYADGRGYDYGDNGREIRFYIWLDDVSSLGGTASNPVTSYTYSSSSTWTCPDGVYSIDLTLVGSGGHGGNGGLGGQKVEFAWRAGPNGIPLPIPVGTTYLHGGGGGGAASGGVVMQTMSVTPGHTYYLYIDSATGSSTRFNYDPSTILESASNGMIGGSGQDARLSGDAGGHEIPPIVIPPGYSLFGEDGAGGIGGLKGAGGIDGEDGHSDGTPGNGADGYYLDYIYHGAGGNGGNGALGYPDSTVPYPNDPEASMQFLLENPGWIWERHPGSPGTPGYIKISYAISNSTAYAPTASFDTNVSSGLAPLTVQFNDTSTGFPTSWNWNFGDGTTSTGQNPSHTYNNPGTYYPVLTVSNDQGTDSTPAYYQVIVVTAYEGGGGAVAFVGDPLQGNAPLSVQFTDLSGNSPTSWYWDFGDDFTSFSKNPIHTYISPGTYTVKLWASNNNSSAWENKTNYITVGNSSAPGANESTPDFLDPAWHASPISGLPPLTVQFTEDTAGATSRYWDFGDGNTSTATNPSHVYSIAGLYNIKYSATNASGTVWLNRTGYINVNTRIPTIPVADFRALPTSGLNPLTVQFTDYSIGTPTSWNWDFGDGSTSSAQNPVHTFQNMGTYTVKLQSTNANGSDWENKTNYINTYNFAPQADFSASPTSGNSPLTVSFLDESSIDQSNNPITSWYWDFGDGQSSTIQNPTHVYNLAGAYTVRLKVTSNSGSTWMNKTNYIAVQTPPVANFIGIPTAGDTPLTVTFTDQSTGSPTSWNWNFGDGSTSTVQNPSHTYTSSGSYTVILTATNAYGSNIITKINYVSVETPPVANFTANPTSGNSPLMVYFVDTSYGDPTSWAWDFGDGNTSNLRHPYHAYFASGSYPVTLTVTNEYGSNTKTKASYIQVNVPATADFSAAPTFGYAPMNVNFYDQSTGGPISWSWNFGDGNSSTVQNPSHVYSTPGNYTVTLTAANAYGGTTKTKTNHITVLPQEVILPAANFAGNPISGNTPLTVSFTDLSSGSPTSWLWNFGDGNTSADQNPSHIYSAAGSYTVTLTVTNGNGTNSLTKTNYISVSSPGVTIPVANFAGLPLSGNSPLAVSFSDLSTGSPTSWVWDFGDGSSSTLQNPSHTYNDAGTYTVSLTATNANGSNTNTKDDYVSVTSINAPTADFSAAPRSGSSLLTVTFTDLSTGGPTSWSWVFGDGETSTQQNPSHTFTEDGTYTVILTATNAYGSNTEQKSNYITVGEGGGTAPPSYDPDYPEGMDTHKMIEESLQNFQPVAAAFTGLLGVLWLLTFIQVAFR